MLDFDILICRNPHPFIALITPLKGKRFIGRLGRDLTDDQKLMTLGVIVNRIEQVDVIRNSSVLDSIDDSRERRNMEKQAFAFQEYVVNQGLQLSPAMRTLKTYTALIEMMMEDGAAFARVVRTRVSESLVCNPKLADPRSAWPYLAGTLFCGGIAP